MQGSRTRPYLLSEPFSAHNRSLGRWNTDELQPAQIVIDSPSLEIPQPSNFHYELLNRTAVEVGDIYTSSVFS